MAASVRIASIAVVAATVLAAPAAAAPVDRCVDVQRASCVATYDDVPAAVAAAAPQDTIVIGGEQSGVSSFSDAGKALYIRGVPGAALLAPVVLTGDGSALSGVRVEPPSGSSTITADGGRVTLDDVVVRVPPGADGLVAHCATLTARHVTIAGPDNVVAARSSCSGGPDATLDLWSSVLDGPTELMAVTTHFTIVGVDPKLDDDLRPQSGSPVIDAGDPAPLAADEPFQDAAGVARITDGDGDGAVRRDAGAYELQPPAVAMPAGNVLTNPGAEDGLTGWSGTFQTAAFGDPFFPSTQTGAALGAGTAFFAGGGDADPVAIQRIGISASAKAIDTGQATARLSGLLGGYGGPSDGDTVTVTATFLDPEGGAIDPPLRIGPVTAAERGNDTNLLFRDASGPIPARTRAIDVAINGHRVAGSYTDAYADNLALELSVPGAPVDPQQPIVPGLKPFAGVTVLHPEAKVTRAGRLRVALACASATVRACSGTLELRARVPRTAAPARIALVAPFSVAPGRQRGVYVKLLDATRRALKRRTKIGATLRAVATDGQGLQRVRTVPLRLRLPRRR